MSLPTSSELDRLKHLLIQKDDAFFACLSRQTFATRDFNDLFRLSTIRKRAANQGFVKSDRADSRLRLAIIGGCSLYPISDLVQHCIEVACPATPRTVELFTGQYDNYMSEVVEEHSALYEFRPEVIFLIPSERLCSYDGPAFDSRTQIEGYARKQVFDLLELCRIAHERTNAEVILANFPLPGTFDPGSYRTRTAASDWNFRKIVNLELGLSAPEFVHICDVEFLSARCGTPNVCDARAWFESKQPYSANFLVDVAAEVSHIASGLRRGTKKLLALDLDNTLWGGVLGDDGLDGIEIGDTSPRGEAFKAFQRYLKSLTARGILLAACSKNDHSKAVEAFEKHPEMVLRMNDFVSFKANWEPKSDNLRQIATELGLGLDSFVFVDDNPAEIEIVQQFTPQVETVLLPADPSEYVRLLRDSRHFEPLTVTREDLDRVSQYQQEGRRQELLSTCTDMAAYLGSLQMSATIEEFRDLDMPRIAQLVNKSNQFNLTTRRRTESELRAVMNDPSSVGFSVRLSDRFGDHGLIAVVICKIDGAVMDIDTWLMSCRVLKRQVEEEIVNEVVRLALDRGCHVIRGRYVPTAKNGMVSDLYPRMGFAQTKHEGDQLFFELRDYERDPIHTAIKVVRRAYEQAVSV